MDISFAVFLLSLGLVARLSHLVVDDAIMAPLRMWVFKQSAKNNAFYDATGESRNTALGHAFRFVYELINCIHCFSVWVSAAVGLALYKGAGDHKWFVYVAAVATFSYITGLLATLRYKWSDES